MKSITAVILMCFNIITVTTQTFADKDSLVNLPQELVNVYDFTIYLPIEIEDWYNRNNDKGEKSEEWVIGEFYGHPSLKSIKVGELLSYFKSEVNNFVLQFKSTDRIIKKELKEIGDWGYELHLNVIDTTNQFVKGPMKYFQRSAWLCYRDDSSIEASKNKPIIYGSYTTYTKQSVSLPRVTVIEVVTNKQTFIEAGIYFVESSSKEGFIIRKEMSEDMPCGDNPVLEIEDKVMKQYLLKMINLKDPEGNYQIKTVYARGC